MQTDFRPTARTRTKQAGGNLSKIRWNVAAVACAWAAEEQSALVGLVHLADILRLAARRVSVGGGGLA